ncbi:MAG: DUF2512 family protein [Bacillota bacterium]|nr:DUF2512 family protein [Bacillota bacterium]MDW7682741.1 DUF2512 family protein [Bacillota bacterium]
MRTFWALAIKFVMTLLAAAIAGFASGMTSAGVIFLTAAVGTVVNYIMGDLFILPAAGNAVASIADGGVAAVLAYIVAIQSRVFITDAFVFALVFGLLVAIGEYFFHKYLAKEKHVAPNP